MKKNIEGVGEVMTPSTLKGKVQNFWYHYKWHSLLSIVVIIAIIVCSLQFCSKESYDSYILYAGSKSISKTRTDGDVAEIETVITSLKRVSEDFDGDGENSVNFLNLLYMSSEEIAALEGNVNDALLMSDKSTLSSVLENSEYYLCFISEAVYEGYHLVGTNELFIDLSEHKSAHPELEYYNDCAIYLSSTGAYSLPGLSSLPKDTLICIRRPSVLGAKTERHSELFDQAKEMLDNILKMKKV